MNVSSLMPVSVFYRASKCQLNARFQVCSSGRTLVRVLLHNSSTPELINPNHLLVDAANALSPIPRLLKPLPRGIPHSGSAHPGAVHLVSYDATKSDRILGLKYRSISNTTEGTLADYAARGW